MTPNNFVNGAAKLAVNVPTKKRIVSLDQMKPELRLLLFGNGGTGKTQLLAELILAGYRCVVIDSDVGGDGLNTVRSFLKENGGLNKFKNCMVIPIDSFQEMEQFNANPQKFFDSMSDVKWADFKPQFLFWDGFGNFQQTAIWDYALGFKGIQKNNELREAGMALEPKDYQTVLNATHDVLNQFGKIEGVQGEALHKVITCHLDDREVDAKGQKMKFGEQNPNAVPGAKPMISGQGIKMVLGWGDYSIKTFTEANVVMGKTTYCWNLMAADGLNAGKVRGKMLEGGPIIKNVKPIERWKEMLANISIG